MSKIIFAQITGNIQTAELHQELGGAIATHEKK
jgi:hypothetical protein